MTCTVFVGSYADAAEPGIRAFRIDLERSHAIEIGRWSGVTNPSFLAASPDGRRLYAVSETASGRVHAFDIVESGGGCELLPAGDLPSGGDAPCHLEPDREGRWVAVSNYGSGSVSLLGIDGEGRFDRLLDTVQFSGTGPVTARQDGPHAHSATQTPDAEHLIVADLGADRLRAYATGGGRLQHRFDVHTAPGAGPRHCAIRDDGTLVVANELDCTVSTYRVEPATDAITPTATSATLPPGAPDSIVSEVRLSPGGDRVHVANRGDDSIAVFDLDPTGGLTGRGRFASGGSWPRHFTILPGGTHLLVANERSHDLALLRITAHGLDDTGVRIEMPTPTYVLAV